MYKVAQSKRHKMPWTANYNTLLLSLFKKQNVNVMSSRKLRQEHKTQVEMTIVQQENCKIDTTYFLLLVFKIQYL